MELHDAKKIISYFKGLWNAKNFYILIKLTQGETVRT
jgi:hypothetical protein